MVSKIEFHFSPPLLVVVDAHIDRAVVHSRTPEVVDRIDIIGLGIFELVMATIIGLQLAVCDDVIPGDVVPGASACQVSSTICVVLHQVAGDAVVTGRIQIDAIEIA